VEKTIVYINGRFLSQRVTGVQRFARNVVKFLDKNPQLWGNCIYIIVIPSKNILLDFYTKSIKKQILFGRGNYWWEQVTLPLFILSKKKSLCLNLCNLAPFLLKKRNFIVIHDVSFVAHPEFFSFFIRLFYSFTISRVAKYSRAIFTDSAFSKSEIEKYWPFTKGKISVVGCGGIDSKISINNFDEHGNIENIINFQKPFFFSVGSLNANKNISFVIGCAKRYPELNFYISGSQSSIFSTYKVESLPNVHFLGYLSDSQIAFLYSKCYAFIFPSIYEGFGLPPLEALSFGCRRLVLSDIPVFHEIFDSLPTFINPHDCSSFNPNKIRTINEKNRLSLLHKYSWALTAQKMLDVLNHC
jgi:glycosyltransferase involved in cell wall biosynthesis